MHVEISKVQIKAMESNVSNVGIIDNTVNLKQENILKKLPDSLVRKSQLRTTYTSMFNEKINTPIVMEFLKDRRILTTVIEKYQIIKLILQNYNISEEDKESLMSNI